MSRKSRQDLPKVSSRKRLVTALKIVVILGLALSRTTVFCEEKDVFLREDFNDLEQWKLLYFPTIKEHTQYSIEKDEQGSYLRAESRASASGIVYISEFPVYDYPQASWRWKISNVYEKGNAEEKSGDDYPIRIYITFKYDPERASFTEKIKYGVAKRLYGEYPPHSSLNYIWGNREQEQSIITNAYADEAKMVILRSGDELAGTWQTEKIDILADYRKAFGADPPATASMAIMNDSDNTGESSTSYVDYIEVFR